MDVRHSNKFSCLDEPFRLIECFALNRHSALCASWLIRNSEVPSELRNSEVWGNRGEKEDEQKVNRG